MVNEFLVDLNAWAAQEAAKNAGHKGDIELSPILSDAGFRNYYRLNTERPLLVVYAPINTEDSRQFVRVASWLRESGVHAPWVVSSDFERGFLMLEDFGDTLLQPELDADSVAGLYGEALNVLLHLQSCEAESGLFPSYNASMLDAEMQLCHDWFFGELLGLTLTDAEREVFNSVKKCVVANAQSQRQVVVHKDFHSRNILLLDDGSLGVIDFQDAVIGPYAYDVASLLKDCYVRWDDKDIDRWALAYAAMLTDTDVIDADTSGHFLRDFDWIGLQRHIKVLGIFARLCLRDGKERYLNDLPRVLGYVLVVLRKYPEFTALLEFFEHRVLPEVAKQSWASDAAGI